MSGSERCGPQGAQPGCLQTEDISPVVDRVPNQLNGNGVCQSEAPTLILLPELGTGPPIHIFGKSE